jgi:hypothetical protein
MIVQDEHCLKCFSHLNQALFTVLCIITLKKGVSVRIVWHLTEPPHCFEQ